MKDLMLLLDLPFALFWLLATGYLAYQVASSGQSHARSFDTIFQVVAFSSIAQFTQKALVVMNCFNPSLKRV